MTRFVAAWELELVVGWILVARRFRRLDEHFDRFEENFGAKLGRFGENISVKLDSKFDAVGAKIDSLTARINALTMTIEGEHRATSRPDLGIERNGKLH